jgi:competence protein ComEC
MNPNRWNEIPLLRFVPVFIAGIVFGIYSGARLEAFVWLSLLPMTLVVVFYFFPMKIYSYGRRWVFGAAFYLVLFLCGSLLTVLHNEKNYVEHFSHYYGAEYVGVITEPLKEKAKSYRTTIEVREVKVPGSRMKTTGNCLAYISKDLASKALEYGDVIVFTTVPDEVLGGLNPLQFDFRQWLSVNKTYEQVYIPEGKWSLIGRHEGNFMLDYAFGLREKCLSIFRENNLGGQDYAVLSALLLGDEHEIDEETIEAYQASGVLHVLSVSGMHVGIIFLALNFLLGFMDKRRWSKIIKAIIVVLFLWFYAALTGLAPAVLRSATMLSFMVFGSLRKNPASIYNSLLASCVFLLLINPFLILQASFQLSYLAVAGIVLLQRRIKWLFETGNFFLSKVWDIVSVSLAAQLATFPLGLLYFHQFPNYFILSNLLIIPLSSLIIYSGIFLIFVSPFQTVSHGVGAAVAKLVNLLNNTVAGIEHLPFSTIHGVSITVFETSLIYLLIFAFIFYLVENEKRFLTVSVIICVVLLGIGVNKSFEQNKQKMMAVYNVPRKSCLAFIDAQQCALLADTSLTRNKSELQFNVYPHLWSKGINENYIACLDNTPKYSSSSLLIEKNFIDFNGLKILLLNDKSLLNYSGKQVKIDFVILSKNVRTSLKEIRKKFSARQIIIDSSNSLYATNKWMKESKQLNIACHSVVQNGAFVFDIYKKNL